MTRSQLLHLESPRAGSFRFSENIILKAKEYPEHLEEASVLRFVRSKTSIPVPEVLDTYTDAHDPERGYLVMSYETGNTLQELWPSMSSDTKSAIEAQLREHISQMRSIKGTAISAPDGGQGFVKDEFFNMNDNDIIKGPFGPFEDEPAFHEGLIKMIRARDKGVLGEMLADMLRSLPPHEVVFTHGDLELRNIIIRDGNVVAITDRHFAEFRPAYWEYIKVLY